MKKWIMIAAAVMLLAGCSTQETMETVADDLVAPALAQMREISAELPEEAAAPTVESESGRIYLCDGYEVSVQTFLAGDLDATIRGIAGYGRDDLTVMHTRQSGLDRYEFVWACAGESGERIGRAAILDDGNYHYVLTVLGDAETAHTMQEEWLQMFRSFCLV